MYILIISSPCLSLPRDLPTESVHALLDSHMRTKCTAHFINVSRKVKLSSGMQPDNSFSRHHTSVPRADYNWNSYYGNRAGYGTKCFSRWNTGVMCSNATRGMDVCFQCFCCPAAALRSADHPSEMSCRLSMMSITSEEFWRGTRERP